MSDYDRHGYEPPSLMGSLGRGLVQRFTRWVRRRIVPIVIALGILVVLFVLTVGSSLPDDGEPVTVSTDAATSFATKLASAVGDAPGAKAVDITMTEEEVTSFLSIATLLSTGIEDVGGTGDLGELGRFLGEEAVAGTDGADEFSDLIDDYGGLGEIFNRGIDLRFTIAEPEVRFRADGAIVVRGYGKVGPLSIPARLVVTPQVTDEGLDLEVLEGQLGRLPLPPFIADPATAAVEKALVAGHSIAAVSSVDVSDGSMRFSGELTR